MRLITISIPTIARSQLLKQTVESLKKQRHNNIHLVITVDGNPDLLRYVNHNIPLLNEFRPTPTIQYNDKRRDWIWSQNYVLRNLFEGDAFLYASDDLVFGPDTIGLAVNRLFKKAPDGDGMATIEQDIVGCSSAFGLIGRKFTDRFPNRRVFCPDYIHYCSDFELGKYARSVGRMYHGDGAKVIHHRPHDQTQRLAKPLERRDFRAQDERGDRGWLWGNNFDLLCSGDGPRP